MLTRGTLVALGTLALALTGCATEDRDFGQDAGEETQGSDETDASDESDVMDTETDDAGGATDGATDEPTDGETDATDEPTDTEVLDTDVTDEETDSEMPDGGVDETDVMESDVEEPDDDAGAPPVAACDADEDCDDGNVCNGLEICEEGECLSGQRAANGEQCTIDGVDDLLLCIDGNCTPTSCGDGIVDRRTDEQCDDANDQDGDGCEVGCTYSCSEDSECDDGNVCNGEEICDTARHVCGVGEPPENATPCDTERACFDGRCIGLGCGNGVEEAGEDCDDGNADNGDGCKVDCTFTCTQDSDCDDTNICTGTETCDTETHTCVAGTELACEDGNDCTENLCDPVGGCDFPLIDVDGDGHASRDLGACGDDCDDGDGEVYSGASELCDGKDNNCDGDVDEVAPVWYVDCDGDDFALSSAASIQQCDMPEVAPTGCSEGSAATWTARAPVAEQADCYDVAAFVRPRLTSTENNSAWSATEYPGRPSGKTFDHNCNNTEEPEVTATGYTNDTYCDEDPQIFLPITPIGTLSPAGVIFIPNPVSCYGGSGWMGNTVPGCGDEAAYSTCSGWTGACVRSQGTRVQRCR